MHETKSTYLAMKLVLKSFVNVLQLLAVIGGCTSTDSYLFVHIWNWYVFRQSVFTEAENYSALSILVEVFSPKVRLNSYKKEVQLID